jgi:hypothetical protein
MVRLEIEAGLARGIPVIPVMVHQARMPQDTELPPTIRALANLHGIRLAHETFRQDISIVMAELGKSSSVLSPADQDGAVLAQLAEAVGERCGRQRESMEKAPLPVPWAVLPPKEVKERWTRVRRDGRSRALPLDGSRSLADVVRGAEHHGRVVILGAPGGGKTALALRLALDLLAERRATEQADVECPPVPVVLRLSTWNPWRACATSPRG